MNDREWIHEALGRYESPLILYAAKVGGDPERARDAVQETFLELCVADRSAVEPRLAQWLFTVCRNKARDLRRKEAAMRSVETDLAEDATGHELEPSAVLDAGESQSRMLSFVACLPAKQQEVLRLKFQGGLSYKEIAAVTGDSIGNVGFLLHVALRALRERMAVKGEVVS